ncbi:fused MFS/spermidine synthase [Fundidesulfovibrio magnetotacticus]|uniref:fused MFS/spermidine synthase n=1 Tax=Fundidesulfovibrio magnetotacticus TaxID=2730080 RepID=UPI0015649A48|nr:fused MFS/spermidine synthase [Fundidesulfovibrio magnetotacticus]
MVCALVFATGAAAMMDQIVWQRYLARLLGGDASATAVVLAAFLGGLSLGYRAFGRLAQRVRNPYKAYALAEGFIGLWCLAFPALFAAVEQASAGLSLTPPWGLALQGLALAAVLVGPPTVCMGATAPLLTQALSRDVATSGAVHARVYGVNTAGAFLGAVAAGYVAVPELGLPGTLVLAASLNLLAAAWFALARDPVQAGTAASVAASASSGGRSLDEEGGPGAGPPSPSSPGRGLGFALMGLAFLNGFQSMGLENVLVRFVALSSGGSAYAFTMVVGMFVLAIAAGALLAGRFARLGTRAVWLNQMAIAALLLLLFPSLDTWPYWAHRLRLLFAPDLAGFWACQAAGFAALSLAAGGPALLIGAAVPLVFNRLRSDLATVGSLSGRILCANTVGNLTGSLAAGILLHPLLNNGQIYLLCAVLSLAGAWLAARELGPRTRLTTGLAALAALALIPAAPGYDAQRFMMGTFRLQMPLASSCVSPKTFFDEFHDGVERLFQEDGPEGTASVLRAPRQIWHSEQPLAVFVNGKSDSSTVADMSTLRLLAHIPALLAPSRGRSLVIGLGTGVTSGELARYADASSIETAEISSSVIKALPLFAAFTGGVHREPRHRLLHGDAFRILARSADQWDLIVSEPSNPWVLGVDALFSREFYRLADQCLAPGGVFAQWVHVHDASAQVLGTVISTLRERFPCVRVFMTQANDLLLLASREDLAPGVTAAGALWAASPGVRASLAEAGICSLEALLGREFPLPALTGPVQTLDKPMLHYIAGRNYFMGARVSERQLLSGAPLNAQGLLERYVSIRPEGRLERAEASAILSSAVDRRGEEATPLPLEKQLEERLETIMR